MPNRLLVALANTFVVAYTADAGFSLVEELVRLATGSTALLLPRNAIALMAVSGALLVLPAVVLSPRLPALPLLLLATSAIWMNLGALPLPLLVEAESLGFWLCGLQLVLAVAALLWLRARSDGRRWLIEPSTQRPVFSLQHTLLAGGGLLLGGGLFALLYTPLWLLASIQALTDSYVRFDLAGISLADRRFERDGQEIRLVGMMHIGEREGYQGLVESFSGSSTVILTEGVTDREARLEEGLSYDGIARSLGLEPQETLETYFEALPEGDTRERPVLRHADVDLSEFHPETVTWLGEVADFWDGEDSLSALAELYAGYQEDPERWTRVADDILTLRNRHLMVELRDALDDYQRVIVPWGALHLPHLQDEVLGMGFEPTERTHHPLASWATVVEALSH